jgi:hypothetical protein
VGVSATAAGSTTLPDAPETNGCIEITRAGRVLGLAGSRTVKNGAGSVVEQRTYTYDQVATGNLTVDSVHDMRPGVDAWRDWKYGTLG